MHDRAEISHTHILQHQPDGMPALVRPLKRIAAAAECRRKGITRAHDAHHVPISLAIFLEGSRLQVPCSTLPAEVCEPAVNHLHGLLA